MKLLMFIPLLFSLTACGKYSIRNIDNPTLVKSKICCKFSSIQSMTNGFLAREGNNVVALSGGDSGSHPFGVFTHIQVSPFLPNFVFLGQ